MKSINTLFIRICLVLILQAGAFKAYASLDSLRGKIPVKMDLSYIADGLYNFRGGIQPGVAYLGLLNLKLSLDGPSIGLPKGSSFYLNLANSHKTYNATSDIVGDLQGVSNIEFANNKTYVQEFWYRQELGKFSLILGLQDLCNEFLYCNNSAMLLNSSFGAPSPITQNFPAPIYPYASLGLEIHYQINEFLTAKIALFDGLPDNLALPDTKYRLHQDDGYFVLSDFIYKNPDPNHLGFYKLGAFYHSKYALSSEPSTAMIDYPANYGVYFMLDQSLFKSKNGRDFRIFGQFMLCPKDLNQNYLYFSGGGNITSPFLNRPNDILAFGFNNSRQYALTNESLFEISYKLQLGDNLFIQPDFQYVINPVGTGQKLENACVAILRLGFNF